jgi:antitoxin component YwqK of YwqJK toxin-antitoxin module
MIEKEWHENGQLKSETVQVDGRKVVIYSEWHKNGNIAKRTTYKKNKKIEQSIFNNNGKPISQMT